jgi:hypothetical protein
MAEGASGLATMPSMFVDSQSMVVDNQWQICHWLKFIGIFKFWLTEYSTLINKTCVEVNRNVLCLPIFALLTSFKNI